MDQGVKATGNNRLGMDVKLKRLEKEERHREEGIFRGVSKERNLSFSKQV